MRHYFVLLGTLLGVLLAAAPAAAEARSMLHRKGVENSSHSPGWHLAAPTGGKFRVALPCPFTDSSTKGADPKFAVETSRTVACRIGEGIQFTARELDYRSERDALEYFEKTRDRMRGKAVPSVPPGYRGNRTMQFETRLNDLDGRTRTVLVGKRIYLLVVEWRPAALAEVQQRIPIFFSSFQIES